jgi:hypothetical protein
MNTVITQYRPPAGLSVVEAAELLQQNSRAVVAQLIDFAARKVVVVVPGPKRRSFRVVRTDRPVDNAAEKLILRAVFGDTDRAGASVTLTRHRNAGLSARLADAHREIVVAMIERELVARRPWALRLIQFWDPRPVAPTPRAEPIRVHLEGLRRYISLAEADRMRLLLGPDSAIERPTLDGESVLVIHERLLGYAVLFGLQKEWVARIVADYRREVGEAAPAGLDPSAWVDVAVWEAVSISADIATAAIDLSAFEPTDSGVEASSAALDATAAALETAVGSVDVLDGLGSFLGGI